MNPHELAVYLLLDLVDVLKVAAGVALYWFFLRRVRRI